MRKYFIRTIKLKLISKFLGVIEYGISSQGFSMMQFSRFSKSEIFAESLAGITGKRQTEVECKNDDEINFHLNI